MLRSKEYKTKTKKKKKKKKSHISAIAKTPGHDRKKERMRERESCLWVLVGSFFAPKLRVSIVSPSESVTGLRRARMELARADTASRGEYCAFPDFRDFGSSADF